jgi:dienelactone hydrolase
VELLGKDDLPIAGTLYVPAEAPQPWPGVLLLHMLGRQRGDWEAVATELSEAGYAVLAIDMRGHGDTNSNVNWSDAAVDHRRAVNYLGRIPGIDNSRIAVMGASIGSNMALQAGTDNREINTVILLSPGLDYAGVTTENILSSYGGRPILIVASREDTYSAESSDVLASKAQGEASLVMYDGAGHGTAMFNREPGLINTVVEWLDTHL